MADKCPVDHRNSKFTRPAPHSMERPFLSTGKPGSSSALNTERQVSSIPRSEGSSNWVYPSEEMFFNAMKRKDWDPNQKDMKTIVPIHNAVNERAWNEILRWENGQGSATCGGPKLVSFKGNASRRTPKSWILSMVGYQAPFDRHDWTVDRCGKKIEYVIDFYQGRQTQGEQISFHLDVRPKLSIEGLRMRALRLFER